MRRFCIALSALIPLLCEAAKLTHYADSAFVVKYPMNESTNTPPTNPPRWLEEDCIPGGSHPSNQVKRITLDVACAMAGTADAYLRRNIAASLFGTSEMAGYTIGTQHVTGAEYATTNFLASRTFERNVLGYRNRGPYDTRNFPFAYTNLDYYTVRTNDVVSGNTRRLFCDQYLMKPESMLAGVIETNEWNISYSRPLEYNIRDLEFARNSFLPGSELYTDRWMHEPPVQIVNDQNEHGIGLDTVSYGYGLAIAWGSSHAESAVYSGTSNSDWLTDPTCLVSDWSRFYPSIANLFNETNFLPYASSDPSYKNLDYSVLDSVPGKIAFQTDNRSSYSEFPDKSIERLRWLLHGSFGYDEQYEQPGNYMPYPGRKGFDLMADTCGRAFTNFNPVVSRRMIYEPWEQCNSFLGLVDTLYVGQDAMPEFVYCATNETAVETNEWYIDSMEVAMTYVEYGKWHAEAVTDFHIGSYTNIGTNIVNGTSYTRQKTTAFYVPESDLYFYALPTNRPFTRINRGFDLIGIASWMLDHAEPGDIGYLMVEPGDVPGSVQVNVYINGERYCHDWGHSDVTFCKFGAYAKWAPQCTKTSTVLTEFDRTLMSLTNSLPCRHPLNMEVPLDDVSSIYVSSFSGIHATTNTYEMHGQFQSLYESTIATNSLYNLYCESCSSAEGVDYAARAAEYSMASKLNDTCRKYISADDLTTPRFQLLASWKLANPGELFNLIAHELYTNRFARGYSCLAAPTGYQTSTVQIRRDAEGKVYTRYLPSGSVSWDLFEQESDLDYLKVYWIFTLDCSMSTEPYRLKPSCLVKGATTSIEAVHYDFKTMKRED